MFVFSSKYPIMSQPSDLEAVPGDTLERIKDNRKKFHLTKTPKFVTRFFWNYRKPGLTMLGHYHCLILVRCTEVKSQVRCSSSKPTQRHYRALRSKRPRFKL